MYIHIDTYIYGIPFAKSNFPVVPVVPVVPLSGAPPHRKGIRTHMAPVIFIRLRVLKMFV